MREAGIALLTRWESFYVITGTAAATLTGLQFVVITLVADMERGTSETNRAFGTPTIVHFCAALFIAAALTAPWPTLLDVALLLGLCGVAGLAYEAIVIRTVHRQTDYRPVLEDWVWHFTLPPVAYALLLVSALFLEGSPTVSLFMIGGTVLLFLFVGIHNAWDSVTYIALNLHPRAGQREDQE